MLDLLAASRKEAAALKQAKSKCKACFMEAEFVPGGLMPCKHCKTAYYCTHDCMQWDLENHVQTCRGAAAALAASWKNRKMPTNGYESDDGKSIDLLGEDSGDEQPTGSMMDLLAASRKEAAGLKQVKSKSKCKACTIDAEMVAGGLMPCSHCKTAYYCNRDCMQWDLEKHSNNCKGAASALAARSRNGGRNNRTSGYESDDGKSIDLLGGESEEDEPKGSFLERIESARSEALLNNKKAANKAPAQEQARPASQPVMMSPERDVPKPSTITTNSADEDEAAAKQQWLEEKRELYQHIRKLEQDFETYKQAADKLIQKAAAAKNGKKIRSPLRKKKEPKKEAAAAGETTDPAIELKVAKALVEEKQQQLDALHKLRQVDLNLIERLNQRVETLTTELQQK